MNIYLEEIGSVYMVRIEIKCNNTEESKILFSFVLYNMRKKKIYEGRKKNIFEVPACARVCVKKSVKSLELHRTCQK